jgi:hypothetical protein
MKGRIETVGAAGQHHEPLQATVRPSNAGIPPMRIAVIQIELYDFFDGLPEEASLLLIAALKLRQELIEMMEQYQIEDSPLRISSAIDSRRGGRKASKNGPKPWIGSDLPRKNGKMPGPEGQNRPRIP